MSNNKTKEIPSPQIKNKRTKKQGNNTQSCREKNADSNTEIATSEYWVCPQVETWCIFQALNVNYCQPRLLFPTELSTKIDEEISHDKHREHCGKFWREHYTQRTKEDSFTHKDTGKMKFYDRNWWIKENLEGIDYVQHSKSANLPKITRRRFKSKPGRRMKNQIINKSKPSLKTSLSANGLNSPLKRSILIGLNAMSTMG